MRWAGLTALLALLLAAVTLALPQASVANGKGVTIYLGYLPEVSNWGPYEASGQAYVNAGEGRAQITVDHMIHDPALHYEVWLVRADDRDTLFSVGTFQVDDAGHAEVELSNPGLQPAEFRFLVISAEPMSDDDPRPDARRTVAGVFPNAMARPVAGDADGFDGIWAQDPASTTGPTASGSEGEDSQLPGGQAVAGEASPGQAAGDTPESPPRLPVTGAGAPAPLGLLLAAAASAGLMVMGVRKQLAAARVRRERSTGESR